MGVDIAMRVGEVNLPLVPERIDEPTVRLSRVSMFLSFDDKTVRRSD